MLDRTLGIAAVGMDQGAVFVATCLAAAYGSLAMGIYANYPVALAPGMGLNAFFAFVVVKSRGSPLRRRWEPSSALRRRRAASRAPRASKPAAAPA
jgi:hypothetical protein